MTTPVLICDDSSVARKQMARSLPSDWDVDISFAAHGGEAVELIRQGKGDILFLDLNMPVMDGYETLAAIAAADLQSIVIVVSGDIQPDAYKRVLEFGAVGFIKKPVGEEALVEILENLGIYSADPLINAAGQAVDDNVLARSGKTSELDAYQEIANVAMGQAGDLLARLLDVFVLLPVPQVNLLEQSELRMALQATQNKESYSAVCQGFIGSGISGEALMLFHDSSFADLARLMKYEGELNELGELELLMDTASILIGACTKGIAEQLDMAFSQGHPQVLGQHVDVARLMERNQWTWDRMLAIEIAYRIENYDVQCDVLLMFTEDSLPVMRNKVAYLIN